MQHEMIGVYSGWGIESYKRNFGDALCHGGLKKLLALHNITDLVDLRNSIEPIIIPWKKTLIVGGGTVVPTLFEPWTGPGLKTANPIIIFGSGVLSQQELDIKGISNIDKEPYYRAKVIGVRGPLSEKHYQELFGVSVDYVGDLAFAFAKESPINNPQGNILFFLIESKLPGSRTESNQLEILNTYQQIALSTSLHKDNKVLCLTDNRPIKDFQINKKAFDSKCNIQSLQQFITLISKAKFVFTEKLHPAILAANMGIPFMYFQTTSKSRDLELLLKDQSLDLSFLNVIFIDMTKSPDIVCIADNYMTFSNNSVIKENLIYSANKIKKILMEQSKKIVPLIKS